MQQPLIILGGTFSPVHNGHLQIAEYLYTSLGWNITFLPTGIQHYKAPPEASNHDRLAMLELALNHNPHYTINTLEIDSTEFSCTYTTLLQLRREFGQELPIFFIIGEDSFLGLDTWDSWQQLPSLTNLIVVKRGNHTLESLQHSAAWQFLQHKSCIVNFNSLITADNKSVPAYGKCYLTDFIPQNISSTLIRSNIKNNLDIGTLVPTAVEEYILHNNIY